MRKIERVALKKKDGSVNTVPVGKRHADVKPKGSAARSKHGFVDSNGKFLNRKEGAKVANKAKQTKTKTKNLHSTDLKAYKDKK
jgi:hypothetical protein